LALAGVPGLAWDPVAHAAFQRAHFSPEAGFAGGYYAFFYPPPFLLICLPLGLLPYGAALAVWLLVTGAAYVVAMRGLLPWHWPWALIALGFPGLLLNAEHGQNGALSAALFGMAALWLDRRPGFAGVCLGALCFKPQLAVLVVPALVLTGRWRALVWAAGTAWAMCVGSLLVFGVAAWEGFVADSHLAGMTLEAGWWALERWPACLPGFGCWAVGSSLPGLFRRSSHWWRWARWRWWRGAGRVGRPRSRRSLWRRASRHRFC
jgi:alpha-1,2-mannosyltransferase